jgi:hypothetical protein
MFQLGLSRFNRMTPTVRRLLLALVLIFAFGVGQVLAYVTTAPYKLVGGIKSRTYYINDASGNWAADIRKGVASWSPTATYTEATSTGQTIDYDVLNWGNVGWCGITYFLNSDGSYINPGDVPDRDWYRGQVKIQQPPIPGCPAFSKQATAAHEMGHTMGLLHSNIGGVLMSVPTGAQTPQPDDIDGVKSLYP